MVIYGGVMAGSVAQPWRTWLVGSYAQSSCPSKAH